MADFSQRFTPGVSTRRVIPHLGLPKVISAQENQDLIKPPTLMEFRNALFSIDSNRTPGPDVFGADFFKTYWETVKGDLFNAIADFFR